ncbi:MAG: hypothetical protein WCN98_19645 [Verrucomicrobiaceae bacterium]
MKNSWHVIFVLALLVAYLGGFGVIRADCYTVSGSCHGPPGFLVAPEWYHSNILLRKIYGPMFRLEQKITGEPMCNFT